MYTPMFGGSALLHLIAAHPKVIALFGIAATVSLLMAPHGPGRFIGSRTRIERIEAAVRPQADVTEARQAAAERVAARMLVRRDEDEIAAAVRLTLERCGGGCTDISTSTVLADAPLLRRVLVLHELDQQARSAQGQATRR
jgi:hypothetical protein